MRVTYSTAGTPAPKARRSKDRGAINNAVEVSEFVKRFGFAGVEFGNWCSQDERRAMIKELSAELPALAQAFGWPERALGQSVGGVALAFGARGKGGRIGHAAHFERGGNAINITRTKKVYGKSAFVHEWAHALDWHLGDHSRFWSHGPEWKAVMERTPEHMTYAQHRNMPSRPSGRKVGYWTREHEVFARSFEAWVFARFGHLDGIARVDLQDTPQGAEREIACAVIDKLFAVVSADIVGRQ